MTREQILMEISHINTQWHGYGVQKAADVILALHEAEIKEIHRNHLHALNAEHTVQDELREALKRDQKLLQLSAVSFQKSRILLDGVGHVSESEARQTEKIDAILGDAAKQIQEALRNDPR